MFRGRTVAATFAAAAGWVNLLFVGATLAFPFLLYWLLSISGCQRVGGACGALGLGLAIWIKPMIYIAYVLSFLGLAARRLRDAGLLPTLAFGLFVLMLADVQWGIVMGAPWSVGFATGYGGGSPRSLMAGLACVGALSMLPSWAPSAGAGEPRRTLSPVALALLALLMVVALSSLITVFTSMFGGLGPWNRFIYSRPMAVIYVPAQSAVAATPFVVAALCYREWLAIGRPGVGSAWAIAVAICLAVIAAGSAVGALLGAWVYVTQLFGIRALWQAGALILNWTGLPELLALLVLPWLLRFMPGASAAAPAPVTPRQTPTPRSSGQPIRAFGRRGAA